MDVSRRFRYQLDQQREHCIGDTCRKSLIRMLDQSLCERQDMAIFAVLLILLVTASLLR